MLSRIVIDEPDPDDPDMRVYHLDVQFSLRCHHFELPIAPDDRDILNAAGEYVRSLSIMLGSHTGVECMNVQRHSVEIWKGGAYEWKDVEPLVLSALTAAFGAFNGVQVFCRGRLEEKLDRLEKEARKKKRAEAEKPEVPAPDDAPGRVADPPSEHGAS